jgi:hypothetical protein
LVFSIATSKATSNGLEEETEDNSNYEGKVDAGEETEIAIEGMQMLNRHCKEMSTDSMHEDADLGGKEEGGDDEGEFDPDAVEAEMAQLTKNMKIAMANLHIYLSEGKQDEKRTLGRVALGLMCYQITKGVKTSCKKTQACYMTISPFSAKIMIVHLMKYPQEYLTKPTPISLRSQTILKSNSGTKLDHQRKL